MATLCFLEHPIEFGALDGQPVHTLFTIVSPTIKAHLHLLSRLAFALRSRRLPRLSPGKGRAKRSCGRVKSPTIAFPWCHSRRRRCRPVHLLTV